MHLWDVSYPTASRFELELQRVARSLCLRHFVLLAWIDHSARDTDFAGKVNFPLIHGKQARCSKSVNEVKAALVAVAGELQTTDSNGQLRLRSISPHWLRHAYARALVVDQSIPLPAAALVRIRSNDRRTCEYRSVEAFGSSSSRGCGIGPG
jgi:hypothetical protein